MALGVSAYSETPFGAEDSSVIVYPLGIQLTAQENSGIINIDVDVSVTGQALTASRRNCAWFFICVSFTNWSSFNI